MGNKTTRHKAAAAAAPAGAAPAAGGSSASLSPPVPQALRTKALSLSPKGSSSSLSAIESGSHSLSGSPDLHCFSFQQLKEATGNFAESNCIGAGGFGKVYRGILREWERGGAASQGEGQGGVPVAIKRLHEDKGHATSNNEWLVEMLVLSKLRHPNLIRLFGYCLHQGSRLLVYELCENGSLEDRIFATAPEQVLEWDARLRIVQGTACALAFLHQQRIIHRDLKPGNILLAEELTPRVCDFGMAKEGAEGKSHVTTRVMGTMGYLDPEYLESGFLREASDVFAFGVIVLQLLSGLPATSHDNVKLVSKMEPHLIPQVTEPVHWIDPLLCGRYGRESALQLAAIARRCVAPSAALRPTMKDVLRAMDLVVKAREK